MHLGRCSLEFGVCHQSHIRMHLVVPWILPGDLSEPCQNALGCWSLEFGICHQNHVRMPCVGAPWSLRFAIKAMSECLGLVLPGVCHQSHVRMPWVCAPWSVQFIIRPISECLGLVLPEDLHRLMIHILEVLYHTSILLHS